MWCVARRDAGEDLRLGALEEVADERCERLWAHWQRDAFFLLPAPEARHDRLAPSALRVAPSRGERAGYMLKGRVRMHTTDGHQDFVAGEAFYWAPGHAPEALEDSEYVDFSPTHEFQGVIDHITRGAAAAS